MKSTFVVPDGLEPAQRRTDALAPGDRMPSHNRMCFGCGPDAPNGLHLDARAGEGMAITGQMVVEPHFEGGPGMIHGGILSSAFDEIMGMNVMLMGVTAVTAVLNIDFAKPIQLGSRLRFDTEILGTQRRKVYVRAVAHLIADDGRAGDEVGGAHGLFIVVDPRVHFRESRAKSQFASPEFGG
ncbi:PaaI family thioesterase [Williamsia phyllosphaerae]|nr:PaaI family thioesterase [Williamsia phyllosphaerae]